MHAGIILCVQYIQNDTRTIKRLNRNVNSRVMAGARILSCTQNSKIHAAECANLVAINICNAKLSRFYLNWRRTRCIPIRSNCTARERSLSRKKGPDRGGDSAPGRSAYELCPKQTRFMRGERKVPISRETGREVTCMAR